MSDKLRGHAIHHDGKLWRYTDTGEPTSETWGERPCGACGDISMGAGHDPCIGTLPGVDNACCGHGEDGEAYVQFHDGRILLGNEAIDFIRAGVQQ